MSNEWMYKYPPPVPAPPAQRSSLWEDVLEFFMGSHYGMSTATSWGRSVPWSEVPATAISGYGQGYYSGARPLLQRTLPFVDWPEEHPDVVKQPYGQYLQTIPGLEPSESVAKNFGVLVGGDIAGALIDPINLVGLGVTGKGLRASKALKAAGQESLKWWTKEGMDAAAGQIAKEQVLAMSRLKPGTVKPGNVKDLFYVAKKQGLKDAETTYNMLKGQALQDIEIALKTSGPIRIAGIPVVSHATWAKTGIPDVVEGLKAASGIPLVAEGTKATANMPIFQTIKDTPLARVFFNRVEKAGITHYDRNALTTAIDAVLGGFIPNYRQAGYLAELDRAGRVGSAIDVNETLKAVEDGYGVWNKSVGKDWKKLDNDFIFWQDMVKRTGDENVTTFKTLRKGALEEITLTPKELQAMRDFREWNWSFQAAPGEVAHLPQGGIVPQMLMEGNILKRYIDEYSHRLMDLNPESQALKEHLKGIVSGLESMDIGTMHRSLQTLEDLVNAGHLPKTSAVTLTAIRYHSALKAYRSAKMLDELVATTKDPGKKLLIPKADETLLPSGVSSVKDHYIGYIDGASIPAWPQLKNHYVRHDVVLWLADRHRLWETQPFMKMLNSVTYLWKPFATSLNPGYHWRNFASGVYNAALFGLWNPARYAEAAAIQSKYLAKDTDMIAGKLVSDWRREVLDEGVTRANQFNIDLQKYIGREHYEELAQGITASTGKVMKYIRPTSSKNVGRMLGSAIEDNGRVALYIEQRVQGKTPREAAGIVNEAFFDYGNLTRQEKTLRQVFPFYTWSRKNIPLQMEKMIKNPIYAHMIFGAQTIAEDLGGGFSREDRAEETPEWMRGAQSVKTPWETAKGETLFVTPGMPWEDIVKTGRPRDILAMVNPVISETAQQILATDFFSGQPFYPQGAEHRPELQFKKVDSAYGELPPVVRKVFGIRKTTDPRTGEDVVVANAHLMHLWRTVMRPGRTILSTISQEDRTALQKLFSWALGESTFVKKVDTYEERQKKQWIERKETKELQPRIKMLNTEEE